MRNIEIANKKKQLSSFKCNDLTDNELISDIVDGLSLRQKELESACYWVRLSKAVRLLKLIMVTGIMTMELALSFFIYKLITSLINKPFGITLLQDLGFTFSSCCFVFLVSYVMIGWIVEKKSCNAIADIDINAVLDAVDELNRFHASLAKKITDKATSKDLERVLANIKESEHYRGVLIADLLSRDKSFFRLRQLNKISPSHKYLHKAKYKINPLSWFEKTLVVLRTSHANQITDANSESSAL
ncbi:hypothetical protein [Photobacterium kishitanii]|uniref:Uncharacterized protein n=1 Tax=Photobacterium kishitanii TaxID=318456 RepID=A0A2T3KMM8_9GAMM|nr:hypothetical protein [Photobacterium kishitanii]PSV01032.1 hypothetical protein C9J27_03110 [Photobacterium kishitanii]